MVARNLSQPALESIAGKLRGLSGEFASDVSTLKSPTGAWAVAQVREHMRKAGRLFLRLCHARIVEVPDPAPHWVRLSLRDFGRRPYFSGFHRSLPGVKHYSESSTPLLGISQLVRKINYHREEADVSAKRRRERGPAAFRHRHVFMEAAIGWLGVRAGLGLGPEPIATVRVIQFDTKARDNEQRFDLGVDWPESTDESARLYFLDVGEACSRVCCFLADEASATTVETGPAVGSYARVLDRLKELTEAPKSEGKADPGSAASVEGPSTEGLPISSAEQPCKPVLGPDHLQILRALKKAGGPLRTAELISRLPGLGRRTIERRLADMALPKMDHVRRVRRGVWSIADKGVEALDGIGG